MKLLFVIVIGALATMQTSTQTIIVRDQSNNDTYEVQDPWGVLPTRGSCAQAVIIFIPDTTVGGQISQLHRCPCSTTFESHFETIDSMMIKTTSVIRIE